MSLIFFAGWAPPADEEAVHLVDLFRLTFALARGEATAQGMAPAQVEQGADSFVPTAYVEAFCQGSFGRVARHKLSRSVRTTGGTSRRT